MACNKENTKAVLELRGVACESDGVSLLDNIDLQIFPGDVVAVVGPNGAGKSTLLKVIAADLSLTRGQIRLCGAAAGDWPARERARCLAVLPQLSLLNFPYLVEDVVLLGRTPHETGNALDTTIVAEAMRAMDIEHLRGRLYTQLSGGEKQRVQLARVLAQIWRVEDAKGRILLLDEPSTALDLGHQKQLMATVLQKAGEGVGVLMVMHDLNVALQYADKVVALRCGRILDQGSVDTVITEALLEDLFATRVELVQRLNSERPFVLY